MKKVGLTLNNIAISEIEESDTYDENNFFDAQGVKLRTETIQRSIKQKLEVELITDREKQELELNTQIAIEQQKLATQKQALAIEQEKAELIKAILPELIPHLPEIARSLAPQPGVLGDARIYAFPGGGDNSTVGDINKLLLSTSGLALIETFLSQGSLNTLTTLLKQLLNSDPTTTDAEIIETSE